MPELNGTWDVKRTGGLLPPMTSVRKDILGTRGTTRFGSLPGVPFDVVGLELRYRAPFDGFVDILAPEGADSAGAPPSVGTSTGAF